MTLNILLLCNKPGEGSAANTISDHIDAIVHYSSHNVWLHSTIGDISNKLDLHKFDAIIVHYSLSIISDYFLSKSAKQRLRAYNGLKIVYAQDEYRQINKMVEELAFLRTDVLFSCFPAHELDKIYCPQKLPSLAKYNNLTGYVPARLLSQAHLAPIHNRPVHVGYRGRKLPYWYGELAYEKWSIVDKWQQCPAAQSLHVNLSYNEKDRIYGAQWLDFLLSCKATLGVESGASVMDFTGELEACIDKHQLTYPKDSFQRVQEKYLRDHEGKHQLNQISPRCFEAIALKTVLVLYEGEYSGILVPERHYIALKKDFSNIDHVVACLKDDDYLQHMADVAYQEIALNEQYSYQTFMKKCDEIIELELAQRQKSVVAAGYDVGQFERDCKHRSFFKKIVQRAMSIYQKSPPSMRLLIRVCFRLTTAFKMITR